MVGTKWSAVPWGMALTLVTAVTAVAAPAAAHGRAPDRARPSQRVVLMNADTGPRTVKLGDEVEVRLTGHREHGLTYSWSIPVSSDSTVLPGTAGSETPSGNASAVFPAEHRGTATITAQQHCRADPGHFCSHRIEQWTATVEVK
ncbi:hypothetical protein ACQEVS_27405 [Streptomyces sp. CA-181903]|uniref:hypothetical protein n=1 Tax=Streptomyces sp. CA-181903 TaxID=3240055 RepID=UPI003D8FF191